MNDFLFKSFKNVRTTKNKIWFFNKMFGHRFQICFFKSFKSFNKKIWAPVSNMVFQIIQINQIIGQFFNKKNKKFGHRFLNKNNRCH